MWDIALWKCDWNYIVFIEQSGKIWLLNEFEFLLIHEYNIFLHLFKYSCIFLYKNLYFFQNALYRVFLRYFIIVIIKHTFWIKCLLAIFINICILILYPAPLLNFLSLALRIVNSPGFIDDHLFFWKLQFVSKEQEGEVSSNFIDSWSKNVVSMLLIHLSLLRFTLWLSMWS